MPPDAIPSSAAVRHRLDPAATESGAAMSANAFELAGFALLPASGVAESLHAAGIDAACPQALPPHTIDTSDAIAARPASIVELDLRALPAPEPMLRALAAVDALAAGAQLVLRTPMLPVPLLQALAERGFEARAQVLADGTARVQVERPSRSAATSRGGGDGETRA
jgi:uncharacterized protein (DUF2249 family)